MSEGIWENWPPSEKQANKLYERFMAIEGDEMAFEMSRPLETIGQQGLGVTLSKDVMRWTRDQMNLFVGTRIMRRWNEKGLAPQRVVVTVQVYVE